VQAALAEAYFELMSALEERRTFADQVLPGATDAFRKTQRGYQQGGFDYLELLTAQETLAQTRASYLEVLVRLNLAVARVERLVGEPILRAALPKPNRKEEK
jgi:cobalt-zinc-cadmium efflux system outer membrane protein